MHQHPNRYPKHKTQKGQVYNGECNTTACDAPGAIFWNAMTYAFYCPECARGINQFNPNKICRMVTHKPTLTEMKERHEQAMKEYRK